MDIIMNFGEDLELDADNDVVGADTGRVVAKFSHHAEAESFVKFYNNQKKQIAEITSLRAELEIAKKDGWISVDTALPDDEITFLSFSPVYGFQVNMFNIHGNGGLPKLAQLKITHWQPLPEPPKE